MLKFANEVKLVLKFANEIKLVLKFTNEVKLVLNNMFPKQIGVLVFRMESAGIWMGGWGRAQGNRGCSAGVHDVCVAGAMRIAAGC